MKNILIRLWRCEGGFLKSIGKAIGSVVGAASSFIPGADIAAPLITGGLNFLGQSSANNANRDIAQRQMQFQADQTGTAYQRAVADMQAAGLNPMLAYSQGGASSASGAAIPVQNEMSGAVSSALQTAMTKAQVDNLKEQNTNIKTQNEKLKSDIVLNGALKTQALAAASNSASTAQKTQQEIRSARNVADWNDRHPNLIGLGRVRETLLGTGGNPANAAAQLRSATRPSVKYNYRTHSKTK